MTTRRTRKSGTTKRKVTKKVTSSDEESSDSGSITRCVCGQAHNVGLMVQCDECEVWQHCTCMGLSQDKLPKHYYCDKCKPEHHHIIKTSSGRSKRSYNANGLVKSPSISNSVDESTNRKRATKRRKKNDSSPSLSFTDDTVIPDDSPIPSIQSEDLLIEALPRKKSPMKQNNNRHSATPQQQLLDDFNSPATPYWNFIDGKPARESSPPAKIKYPNPKMTFTDMNKRAKQLLECISKLQPQQHNTPSLSSSDEDLFNRPRSLSTCSSLSSASTVPLIEDTTLLGSPSTPIPFLKEESSYEILDRVNRELIKFQRKFGTVYQQNLNK